MTPSSTSVHGLVLESFPGEVQALLDLQWLASMIERLCTADDLRGRLDVLVELVEWARRSDPDLPEPASAEPSTPEYRRWSVLIAIAESSSLKPRITAVLLAIFREADALRLLGETGLPSGRGLFAEASDRILRGILPTPRDDGDLSKLLFRLFPTARAAEQLQAMPAPLFQRLCELLAPRELPYLWDPVARTAEQAFCLLGVRVQALGLSDRLRERGSKIGVMESPFFRLPKIGELLIAAYQQGRDVAAPLRAWRGVRDGCLAELQHVEYQLEASGVSVDVVSALDVIKRSLDRMDSVLAVLMATSTEERTAGARRLLALLVAGQLADRSLRELGRSHLALLARKIVERAGETGDHYITSTRREYWGMVRAAAGGGFLTVGTALLKMKVGEAHLGPFITGLFAAIDYSVSFILLQTFGFALATKQPAMTAATLARIIGEAHRDGWGRHELEQLTTHVARTVRTQLAAAVSNVVSVCLGGVALAVAWNRLWGRHLVGEHKAETSVASLHPIYTGTVFYAVITGVILWLSSLAAGWIDNWSVYRRLPQAIAEHRWAGRWGAERMARVARSLQRNIAGWGGSVSLGFMLGFAPEWGAFFSLPIDVRHVTLSTGTLAIGTVALWPHHIDWRAVAAGGVGIVTIFVMNLSVSFGLALLLALRARDVGVLESLSVLKRIFFRFLRRPGEFLLPPRATSHESGSTPAPQR